jgi:hypothetical protein
MEIEKAIEFYKAKSYEEGGIRDRYTRLAISALEKQLNNGWIAVCDKTPTNFRNKYGELIPFLVCLKYTEYPFRAFYDGEKWGDGAFEVNVIAWQPLPSAYKEVEND